ncbi:hypothetical protein [Streptomyces sp. NPDC051452]|uniref:hypothetical protein n=1 Tax=Streptomyces sp. NPDC051452 TaxID=3365654 RepID=UPI0037BBCC06
MTDTVTKYPATPAAVASAVLDAIEAQPHAFDMEDWVYFPDAGQLPPDAEPECGTTLCAAGWAARAAGWTIVALDDDSRTQVLVRQPDGTDETVTVRTFAQKGEERRLIAQVGAEVLGLKPGETFFYADASTALHRLREIAES